MNIYLCRPLVQNVPFMENAEIVQCPICGKDCWKRPELEANINQEYFEVIPSCTECALKVGDDDGTQI